ncbi:MAG: hypothetical protein Q9M97_01450 [Candidatus Gracilibacteria bacterium]|nr:hypothetical protein [Candidatus Gracilibacteria bacterium]
MIFKFWQKQSEIATKKLLLRKLIKKIDIPENDKELILGAIGNVSNEKLDLFYKSVVNFIEKMELKEIDEIEKNNFVSIDGMTYKQANEKKQKINSFNFLLNNI